MLSPEHTEPSMNKTPVPTFTFYVPNHGKYLCTEPSVNRAMSNLNLCSLQVCWPLKAQSSTSINTMQWCFPRLDGLRRLNQHKTVPASLIDYHHHQYYHPPHHQG